jgi:hypothetical protein
MQIGNFSFADSIPASEFKRIKKEYEFLKEQNEKFYKAIENERVLITHEREAHYSFVKNLIEMLSIFIAAIAALLTFLGIRTLRELKKTSNEYLKSKLEEYRAKVDTKISTEISKIIKEKPEIVENILKEYTDDSKIKKNSKVLIINDSGSSSVVYEAISGDGFEKKESRPFKDFFTKSNGNFECADFSIFAEYQAIIFEKLDGFSEKDSGMLIDSIRTKNEEIKLMFFGFRIPIDKYFKNVSAAQMPAEIGNNLLNLLKK